MKKAVAYYRVSTPRQGVSGLGLEAQQESVHFFVRYNETTIEREYVEVETGKKNNRPILKKALAYCNRHGALLIIAKLDRLGRNVAFIAALMESKVQFVAVDNPYAEPFLLHILAAFAEKERIAISKRTCEALQAAKRRGVKLGKNGKTLAKKNKRRADEFARKMLPVIESLKAVGFNSERKLAKELNKRRIAPFRVGCRWHPSTIHNLLDRIKKLGYESE